MSQFTQESARKLLLEAGVFYYGDADEECAKIDTDEIWQKMSQADRDEMKEEIRGSPNTLNMNDVWGWATSWGFKVPDDKLIEVAMLLWRYGQGGLLYWCSQQEGGMRSEFYDNNRAIEFVENEERIRAAHPGSSAYAYHSESYTITGARKP